MSDYRAIHRALREQGWKAEQNTSGHWRCVPPQEGASLVHFADSGDPRAFHNAIRDLRKSGFIWPWLRRKSNGGSCVESGAAQASQAAGDVDELLTSLRDARDYYYLAVEHLRETAEELESARRAHEAAKAELDTAARTMRKAKRAFDQAFEVPDVAAGSEQDDGQDQ